MCAKIIIQYWNIVTVHKVSIQGTHGNFSLTFLQHSMLDALQVDAHVHQMLQPTTFLVARLEAIWNFGGPDIFLHSSH